MWKGGQRKGVVGLFRLLNRFSLFAATGVAPFNAIICDFFSVDVRSVRKLTSPHNNLVACRNNRPQKWPLVGSWVGGRIPKVVAQANWFRFMWPDICCRLFGAKAAAPRHLHGRKMRNKNGLCTPQPCGQNLACCWGTQFFIAHLCFVLRLRVCVRASFAIIMAYLWGAFFEVLYSANSATMDHLTFNTGMLRHFNAAGQTNWKGKLPDSRQGESLWQTQGAWRKGKGKGEGDTRTRF